MTGVPDDMLAPLTLVVGEEELLVERAVSAVVRAARQDDSDADIRELTGPELQGGDLTEALSPSLFGGRRVVVLRAAHEVPKELVQEVLAAAADVPEQTSLVVVHAGASKGRALLTAVAAGSPRRVDAARVPPWKHGDVVRQEVARAGRRIDDDALALLVEAVGEDLRALVSAVGQLLADTDGPLTAEVVQTYHRGRARTEFASFDLADRAVEGDLPGALERLRWGESTGLRLPGVTAALASTLRGIALVASARGAPPAQVASALSMAPGRVRKLQRQVRGWHPDGLSTALQAVARADADVKGGAVSASYAVERALVAIAGARTGR